MDTSIMHTLAALMSYQEVRTGLVMFTGLILSIALHEFGHAAAAVWLGDPTPRSPSRLMGGQVDLLGYISGVTRGRENRYTVNPLNHADPIGTVALPLTAIFLLPGAALIGWGRPVPFNPHARQRKVSYSRMVTMVSLAGPSMNLIQAILYSGLFVLALALGAHESHYELVQSLVMDPQMANPNLRYAFGWIPMLVALNVVLAIFNLLPTPPLDGGHLLVTYLQKHQPDWARWMQQYGIFLFVLMFPVLGFLLRPVWSACTEWINWLKVLVTG